MQVTQDDGEFVKFVTPAWGIRAMCIIIQNYNKRLSPNGTPIDTIDEIISTWAPSVENNTKAYINHVDADHPKTAFEKIDPYSYDDMDPLIRTIIEHENSGFQYPQQVVDTGLDLAHIKKEKVNALGTAHSTGGGTPHHSTSAAGGGADQEGSA